MYVRVQINFNTCITNKIFLQKILVERYWYFPTPWQNAPPRFNSAISKSDSANKVNYNKNLKVRFNLVETHQNLLCRELCIVLGSDGLSIAGFVIGS